MKSTARVFQLTENGTKTVTKCVRKLTKTLFHNRQIRRKLRVAFSAHTAPHATVCAPRWVVLPLFAIRARI